MKAHDLEGGGTMLELTNEEVAIVLGPDGDSILVPPMDPVPETVVLFVAAFSRVSTDPEFRDDMMTWFLDSSRRH